MGFNKDKIDQFMLKTNIILFRKDNFLILKKNQLSDVSSLSLIIWSS